MKRIVKEIKQNKKQTNNNKKKTVCFILPKGFPVPNVKGGAIETLITNLIEKNEQEKRIKITVVSLYDKEAYKRSLDYKMCNFIYVKKDIIYYFYTLKVRIHNLFCKEKYNTYNEYILSKIKKCYFNLVIVEDGNYFCFKHYLKFFEKKKMVLHMHHDGISNSSLGYTYDKFIGISDYVVNKFKNNSNIKQYYKLMNGIDLNKFKKEITSSEKTELRKKYGFTNKDFIVLFCGRIIKEKGILELVQAINEIKNENIKLLIVGSVNFSKSVMTQFEINLREIINQGNKIKLTGYIKNEELYKYYKIADIQVVPSILEEAAGLVAIEGMISGLPLIVTNSGGMIEYVSKDTIVVEKKINLVENLKTEIMHLYNDKMLMNKMIRSGVKTAKGFGKTAFYNNFCSIVENMVGDNSE